MGKVDDNKRQKKDRLLKTAFSLFTEKGFSKTTISDIIESAGLAKGTFYLYFKDKYDLRDELIVFKAEQLFDNAHRALEQKDMGSFEEELLFITDYIIDCFQKQQALMRFIAKNLSWGIFKNTFSNKEFLASQRFYTHYLTSMEKYGIHCDTPELMLFTIIEFIGATSYNCILYGQPVSIEEYLPYLHQILRQIIHVYTAGNFVPKIQNT